MERSSVISWGAILVATGRKLLASALSVFDWIVSLDVLIYGLSRSQGRF